MDVVRGPGSSLRSASYELSAISTCCITPTFWSEADENLFCDLYSEYTQLVGIICGDLEQLCELRYGKLRSEN